MNYPSSYPYTPFAGAYLEPVSMKPAVSTMMASNAHPFGASQYPGTYPESYPYTNVIAPADPAIPAIVDALNTAWQTFNLTPAVYGDDLAYLQSNAPQLAAQYAGLDYATEYQKRHSVSQTVDPAVPAVLDALNTAWQLFNLSPDNYSNDLAFLQQNAPDLAANFGGLDYETAFNNHWNAQQGPGAGNAQPAAAPVAKKTNVGVLAALAAGAYFLFGRK